MSLCKRARLGVALLCLVLVGCGTPRPLGLNHLIEGQRVLRSASHWRVAADELALQLLSSLPAGSTLQVRTDGVATPFSLRFEDFLEERLVRGEVAVQRRGAIDGALPLLSLRHEVVALHADAAQDAVGWVAPTLGAAGAIGFADTWSWSPDGVAASLLGAGLAASWVGERSSLELVSLARLSGAGLRWQTSRIAYIEPADRSLYERRLPTGAPAP
jgi:hypothetical protein